MNFAQFLEKRNKAFWGITGMGIVIAMGSIDYSIDRFMEHELTFALFYILPISIVTWYAGRRLGLVISAASALALFLDDIIAGSNVSIATYVWNSSVQVTTFVIITFLLSALRSSFIANQVLARQDFVTGAVSIRYFYELAKAEIARSHRYKYPLTLAYIDLDNFKQINDRLGHSTGDRVLRTMTEIIQRQVRPDDVLSRLGGDEFALLLPRTEESETRNIMSRIHQELVKEMLKNGWMVTVSVGAVTFHRRPKSVDEMLKLADQSMYEVKTNGKNGIRFRVVK